MSSDSKTAADWNRECVVCGHKWLGSDRDECPRGPMCYDDHPTADPVLECERLRAALRDVRDIGNMSGARGSACTVVAERALA